MSSISSLTSSLATSLASSLFSKLDTKNQGYIDKTDLQSALSSLSSSSSTTSVDDVFASLDSNQDGKVTESELATSLQTLADQIESQLNSMRMDSAMSAAGSMPPPPPPSDSDSQNDSGFTKAELTSQLSEIGSSDSKRSSLISNIVANFDEADTDGDGKVTMKEAMAYDQASSSSSTTSSTAVTASSTSSDSSSTSSSTSEDDLALMLRLVQLAQSYGAFNTDSNSTKISLLSVVAS
ncbi:MAG: calcium-binding EF-h [Proteobacteria bacterium]|nr:calcium-binding EF-h [Pseudomonadota bacterium]